MPPIYIAPTAAGLPQTPYLTNLEYTSDPDALDTSNLFPGGTAQQNSDALAQKILQSSSWMDRQVHYVLAATIDTERRKVRVRNDGTVRLPCKGAPILEIAYITAGVLPSSMAALASSVYNNIWTEDGANVIEVPMVLGQTSNLFGPGDKVYVQWQYVNGYPNTLLANAPVVGATSLQVTSSLGIYPGRQLTIYDPGRSETITVDTSYVGGSGSSTTIPLLTGTSLAFAHSSGTSISAFPATLKKAAVLATSAHIKTRGGGALVMDAIEESISKEEHGEADGLEDLALAAAMLQTFRINYYG